MDGRGTADLPREQTVLLARCVSCRPHRFASQRTPVACLGRCPHRYTASVPSCTCEYDEEPEGGTDPAAARTGGTPEADASRKRRVPETRCFHIGFQRITASSRTSRRPVSPTETPLGREIDFHALRHTWATFLSRNDVSTRKLQALCRHSDPKLSANVYTDGSQLDTYAAIEHLPRLHPDGEYTPESTLAPDLAGLVVSRGGDQIETDGRMWKTLGKRRLVPTRRVWARKVRKMGMVRDTGFEPVTPTVSM